MEDIVLYAALPAIITAIYTPIWIYSVVCKKILIRKALKYGVKAYGKKFSVKKIERFTYGGREFFGEYALVGSDGSRTTVSEDYMYNRLKIRKPYNGHIPSHKNSIWKIADIESIQIIVGDL